MATKRIQFYVSAHHNVEDFRPYKVTFADRGSLKENVKRALELAIKKEGEWNGWWIEPSGCGELGPDRQREIKLVINILIEAAFVKPSKTHERVVFAYDLELETDKASLSSTSGLVIWACASKKDSNWLWLRQ